MGGWIKSIVMLTVLGIWSIYMMTLLVRGQLPEPALWGVPGGIWLVLNPPFIFGKRIEPETDPDSSEMKK